MITEFIDLKQQYSALKPLIDKRIQSVLDHGRFIMGPEVTELEDRLIRETGARHCITCASGTEALLIALMAMDLRPGDEVITTPFTFIATAEVIVLLGAIPVFVDINPDTANIDPSKIEQAITKKTRAIMPVSLYGQPADMDEINAVAEKYRLAVIEDAAQSFGASYKGKKSCNLSTIGCTSFFPSKPLGCYGDGGAIFTSDDELVQAMREIRVHGQQKRYYHTRIGVGGRMDTLQCAIVLAKLERFSWEVDRRMMLGARYTEKLSALKGKLNVLKLENDRTNVYAQYTVIVQNREDFQSSLSANGVPTAVHYPVPLHRQPAYQRFRGNNTLTFSEKLANSVVSLPLYPDMDIKLQDEIIDIVTRAAQV